MRTEIIFDEYDGKQKRIYELTLYLLEITYQVFRTLPSFTVYSISVIIELYTIYIESYGIWMSW